MRFSNILLVGLVLLILLFCQMTWHMEGFETNDALRMFVINLDKDGERLRQFQESYDASDLQQQIPLTRFRAVWGKDVDASRWLTPKAMGEMERVEKQGHRTHHYQLTPGGVGCFLSHYTLAKQLADESADAYLICEDDVECTPTTYRKMKEALRKAPANWDVILGYTHRVEGEHELNGFVDVTGFWGMGCYLLSLAGSQKLLLEVETEKMDGQIDAYLSRMAQQGKMHVYAAPDPWVENTMMDSNIQANLVTVPGVDPFEFRGYRV